MNKKFLTTLFLVALTLSTVTLSARALAEHKVDISSAETIKTTLQTLSGKSVTLTIGQAEAISGVVEAVGPEAVKLKELSGKEYFSTVVKLSAITSVTYRAK